MKKKKTDPKVNEALRKAVNTAISIKSSEEGMLIQRKNMTGLRTVIY